MSNCATTSICAYPDSDWDEYFRPIPGHPKPTVVEYREQVLSLPDPAELAKDIDECALLQSFVEHRGRLAPQIYREALGASQACASVLNAIGVLTDSPVNVELKGMRKKIIDDISPAIYALKWKFLRGRPWTCCNDELAPLMLRPHWLYPGQPAYPSGHATVAWVFAYLVGEALPQFKPALERAAAQVAWRREVAGVHYPSDSLAGQLLAKQLVGIMLQKQEPVRLDELEQCLRNALS